MLATEILKKRGHRVVVANNGKEALRILEQDRFDVVLMDLQMPEMGGLIKRSRSVAASEPPVGGEGVSSRLPRWPVGTRG